MRRGALRRTWAWLAIGGVVVVGAAAVTDAVSWSAASPGPRAAARRPGEIGEYVPRADELFGGGPDVPYQVPLYGSPPEDPAAFVPIASRLATLDEIVAHLGRGPTAEELSAWLAATTRQYQAVADSLDSLSGLHP